MAEQTVKCRRDRDSDYTTFMRDYLDLFMCIGFIWSRILWTRKPAKVSQGDQDLRRFFIVSTLKKT